MFLVVFVPAWGKVESCREHKKDAYKHTETETETNRMRKKQRYYRNIDRETDKQTERDKNRQIKTDEGRDRKLYSVKVKKYRQRQTL